MSQTVVRWQDLKAVPWNNGGGITRRVACSPADAASADVDWSVSIAEIEADGPFSVFAGVDRVLMLIGGTDLILEVEGTVRRLRVPETLAFSGDAATTCHVPAGSARALNLMTRRGRATGTSRAVDVAGIHAVTVGDGETVVLVALTGGLTCDAGEPMNALDAMVEDAPGDVQVSGTGVLAELRIAR